MIIESPLSTTADIGDIVCLVDNETNSLVKPDNLTVLGVVYRPGSNKKVQKYLYLSDGNVAHLAENVRVIQKLNDIEENSNV